MSIRRTVGGRLLEAAWWRGESSGDTTTGQRLYRFIRPASKSVLMLREEDCDVDSLVMIAMVDLIDDVTAIVVQATRCAKCEVCTEILIP
jgi:hypothetical protein